MKRMIILVGILLSFLLASCNNGENTIKNGNGFETQRDYRIEKMYIDYSKVCVIKEDIVPHFLENKAIFEDVAKNLKLHFGDYSKLYEPGIFSVKVYVGIKENILISYYTFNDIYVELKDENLYEKIKGMFEEHAVITITIDEDGTIVFAFIDEADWCYELSYQPSDFYLQATGISQPQQISDDWYFATQQRE
ncbi:MAG: hypothetical protein FWE86_00510 [Oscillospiraceae bacterium]|nr:hypothetical protein [Oscillospiraceae bacterium]